MLNLRPPDRFYEAAKYVFPSFRIRNLRYLIPQTRRLFKLCYLSVFNKDAAKYFIANALFEKRVKEYEKSAAERDMQSLVDEGMRMLKDAEIDDVQQCEVCATKQEQRQLIIDPKDVSFIVTPKFDAPVIGFTPSDIVFNQREKYNVRQ